MMNRKKKKENIIVEDEENTLFKNNYLLEFQNKSLCTMVEELKEKNSLSEKAYDSLNQKFEALIAVFVNITGTFNEITTACDVALKQHKIEIEETSDDPTSSAVDIISAILNLQDKEKADFNEELSVVSNLRASVTNLLGKLLPILKLNHTELTRHFADISGEGINSSLEETIVKQTQSLAKYQNEKESLKSQCEIYQAKLNELTTQMDQLHTQYFQLKRITNVDPKVPYINFEKKYFNKQDEKHKCVCMVCYRDMNQGQNKDEGLAHGETNPGDSEVTKLLLKEKEALQNRIRELHEKFQNISVSQTVTEEDVQNSKCFQSLILQAENLLTKVSELQRVNIELQNKNSALSQMKENAVNQVTQEFKETIENLNKKIFESSRVIEKHKQTISDLMVRIQSDENIIKSKDSLDISTMHESFSTDKARLMKQMEYIKLLKKEYLNKYDDECEKNKINEETIIKLKSELEDMKQLLHAGPDEKKPKQDDKRKSEATIQMLENENKRLATDLSKERNHNENIIEMIEANEKGITDLNNVIKNLKLELQKAKEIQAKMSNEKLRDNQTISKLVEGKEMCEKKIGIYKDQIDNFQSYITKIGNELEQYKKMSILLQETVKLNESDIDTLKKEMAEKCKEIEKEKSINCELEKKNEELSTKHSKLIGDYDSLKTCYDKGIYTLKKGESTQIQSKEYEMLQKENATYREMIHCNICKINVKNVVINKCFHFFCKECVERTLETRNRKCPICREAFSQNDVKEIFWD